MFTTSGLFRDLYADQLAVLECVHALGIDAFLEKGGNVHVKSNMLAIMLVAIQKGFWKADEATQHALAEQFAALVAEHGLPGSGHTRPDHPMFEWLLPKLSDPLRDAPSSTSEIQPETTDTPPAAPDQAETQGDQSASRYLWLTARIVLLLLGLGIWRGRGPRPRGVA